MASSRTSCRRLVGASVETLEGRLLLSADVTAVFGGKLPSHLTTAGQSHIVMGLFNQGDTSAAGRATVRLYASADPTLGADDTLLASSSRNVKLKHGGHTNLTLRFTAPAALAGGDYYLLAQVDAPTGGAEKAAGRVAISPHSVHVDPANVDLACTLLSIPTQPIALSGQARSETKAAVQVKNVGNTSAKGTASVSFYLSADATFDANDPLLAVATRSLRLKAGQSTRFSASVTPLPPGTAVGGYFLFAVVTPGAGIAETNTTNNTARSAQRVAVVDSLPTIDHHHHHHHEDGGSLGAVDYYTTTIVAVDCGCADGTDNADQSAPDNTPPPDTGPNPSPADESSPSPDTSSDGSSSADSSFDSTGGDF